MEQEFLERCFQEMLDEEDQDWFIPARDLTPGVGPIQQQLNGLSINDNNAEELVVSLEQDCTYRVCLDQWVHSIFAPVIYDLFTCQRHSSNI